MFCPARWSVHDILIYGIVIGDQKTNINWSSSFCSFSSKLPTYNSRLKVATRRMWLKTWMQKIPDLRSFPGVLLYRQAYHVFDLHASRTGTGRFYELVSRLSRVDVGYVAKAIFLGVDNNPWSLIPLIPWITPHWSVEPLRTIGAIAV